MQQTAIFCIKPKGIQPCDAACHTHVLSAKRETNWNWRSCIEKSFCVFRWKWFFVLYYNKFIYKVVLTYNWVSRCVQWHLVRDAFFYAYQEFIDVTSRDVVGGSGFNNQLIEEIGGMTISFNRGLKRRPWVKWFDLAAKLMASFWFFSRNVFAIKFQTAGWFGKSGHTRKRSPVSISSQVRAVSYKFVPSLLALVHISQSASQLNKHNPQTDKLLPQKLKKECHRRTKKIFTKQ